MEPVVRTHITTVTSSYKGGETESRLSQGGLTDMEGAKSVARRLFDTYDRDRDGVIDNVEIVSMIVDAYRTFNKQYNPSRSDIDSYQKVCDLNRDGRVTFQDIEDICVKYLVASPLSIVSPLKKKVEKVKKSGIRYNAEVESRLELARRLFKMIDKDGSGWIDSGEVPELLIGTYKQIGISGYQPTKQDVEVWMAMADTDGDGKVTLEEYEELVLRSLRNAGMKIEKQHIVL